MSQLAKQLFSVMTNFTTAVVNQAKATAQDMYSDIAKEVQRQGSFGAQELASALFSGNAFVLYGGRTSPDERQKQENHERGGMER